MCKNLSGNTAENDGNTKKHALKISPRNESLFAVESVKVCRYKTFWTRIFARRTFFAV